MTYRGKGLDLISVSGLLLISLFLVFVFLPISYGLQRGSYGFTQFGLVPAAAWGIPWLILGTVFFIPLAGWGVVRWRNSRRFISVHKGGVHISLGRNNECFYTWADLQGVRYEGVQTFFLFIPLTPRHRLALVTNQDPQIDIRARINHLDQLCNHIKEGYYPTITPTYRRMFKAGQSIAFGPLQLEKLGIQLKDNRFGWDDIDQIFVQRGKLMVTNLKQEPVKFSVFDIPNLELLLTLINERTV